MAFPNPSKRKESKMENCEICENKRYLIATRLSDDNRRAIERCDSCVSELLDDMQAAALARADGIQCDSDYPCYVHAPRPVSHHSACGCFYFIHIGLIASTTGSSGKRDKYEHRCIKI